MPKTRFLLCIGAALICLTACNPEDMVKKVASDEDQQGATQCIDALRNRRFDAIETHLDPSLRSPETRTTLEHMAGMLPPGQPDAVKLIGANINVSEQGARTADLIYQYSFGKRWFMVNCATRTDADTRSIVALNVKEMEFPIEQQAGFGLANKTPGQYGILVAAVLILGLTLTALITCIMDKQLTRKWLWVLFILVGIGKLSINWNSGTWDFSPVSILPFSVSAVSRGYAGWVLSIALPVGAAVYLARRWLNHRAAARSKAA